MVNLSTLSCGTYLDVGAVGFAVGDAVGALVGLVVGAGVGSFEGLPVGLRGATAEW